MGALTNNEPLDLRLIDDDDGYTIDEAYALLAGIDASTSEQPSPPQVAAHARRPRPPMRIYRVSTT